ncbi:hypothetical protein FA04_14505 [Ensifer adhaerens]|uniref:Chitinase n=1 Tax=Ensifer adhaerens TaxID=106592 RepID=A0ABY8HCH8_ENSAD|nr:hypothetical protein [Ensifer adhaerens]ANK73723.1 hypothetical protein FA04_14505 [Ensifer adhaerens]KDP70315.1 hypothetical protein FA04_29210 [Ensifer adhaerens]WFP89806.1 hypothetical protein P4B07_14730 [Ensifer adhaerens]
MNRAAFYAALRGRTSGVFGTSLSQKQVDGVNAILDEAEKRGTSLFHLAAILAEAYHETGGAMQPVEENLNYSAQRMTQVWPNRFPTVASAKPYANNPRRLANKVYGGRLGNDGPDDGWTYRGRGLAQITGKTNYAKFGIAGNPDAAKDMATAVRILFDGMEKGLFTGRKLSDYDYMLFVQPPKPAFKYYASRAIINGDLAANGGDIDKYGKAFESALTEARYQPASPGAEPTLAPPKPVSPANSEPPTTETHWLARLLQALAALFKRK